MSFSKGLNSALGMVTNGWITSGVNVTLRKFLKCIFLVACPHIFIYTVSEPGLDAFRTISLIFGMVYTQSVRSTSKYALNSISLFVNCFPVDTTFIVKY